MGKPKTTRIPWYVDVPDNLTQRQKDELTNILLLECDDIIKAFYAKLKRAKRKDGK